MFDYTKERVINYQSSQRLTPQQLWNLATEYMKWSSMHPLKKEEVIRSGRSCGEIIDIAIPRVTCWESFCRWASMEKNLFGLDKIRRMEKYREIIADIDHLFYAELIDYASADIINPVLIAKQLGLSDRQKIEITMKQSLFRGRCKHRKEIKQESN